MTTCLTRVEGVPAGPLPAPRRIRAFVVRNQERPGRFFQLRLGVPGGIGPVQPGQFIQLQCHPQLTVPRPFSIAGVDPDHETLDLLYRVVGEGTALMSRWEEGTEAWLLGPLGRPFAPVAPPLSALLIAGGVGLPPLEFLARRLVADGVAVTLLWGLESACPFPVAGDDDGSDRLTVTHLREQSIPNRLASLASRTGFFQGYVTDLAARHLEGMDAAARNATVLYACGPMPMLAAAARLAGRFGLSGQASLEAHMACGFGGCAGCVTPIADEDGGWTYRRVCADGPVFPLDRIAPNA